MDTIPLNYANFLILWALQEPSHGYEIMKKIAQKTKNIVTIGPTTMYRSLSHYLDHDYIQLISEKDNKKKYQLTKKGRSLLQEQIGFIRLLYQMTKDAEEELR